VALGQPAIGESTGTGRPAAAVRFLPPSLPSHADPSPRPDPPWPRRQNKSLPGLLEKLNIIPRGPDKDDSALDTLSESSIDGGVSAVFLAALSGPTRATPPAGSQVGFEG